MKIANKNHYQNVIDFIDAAVDSEELMNWLIDLEKLPNNLRNDYLIKMRRQMTKRGEPEKIIDIVKSIDNHKILSAVNLVIQEVYNSGIRTKRYIKKCSNENYNVLISLLAAP